VLKPQQLRQAVNNFVTIKMNDTEMKPSTSTEETAEKKFINKQTQHGSADNADEENIVVLAKLFCDSPVRITEEDEAVWLEEFDPNDVSSAFSIFSGFQLFLKSASKPL
jgi:hypothetical protein